MKYAYLGELPVEQFGKIVVAFPAIVGIGTVTTDEGETLVACGVSTELEDRAISIYQLVLNMWMADEELNDAVWAQFI